MKRGLGRKKNIAKLWSAKGKKISAGWMILKITIVGLKKSWKR